MTDSLPSPPVLTAAAKTFRSDCADTPRSGPLPSIQSNSPFLTLAIPAIKSGRSRQLVFNVSSELAETAVAVNVPVLGLNMSLVLDTFSLEIDPDVALVKVRYRVALVEVSSDMVNPLDTAAHANAVPFQLRYVLPVVGAAIKVVAPAPLWTGIRLAAPPAMLVAVVAFVAEPALVAYVALVAEPADVAYVALVAEPAEPVTLMLQVPLAPPPVKVGLYEL